MSRYRAALLVAVLVSIAAAGQVHLSWTSDATDTTVTVTWLAPDSATDILEFGNGPDLAEYRNASARWSDACSAFVHTVTLTGLEPATTYGYSLGRNCGPCLDGRFRTAPMAGSRDRVRIAVFGDTQSGTAARPRVRNAVLADDPDLVLHLGDLVDYGGRRDCWDEWFRLYAPLLAHCPVMPTVGNHDTFEGLDNYLDIFALPDGAGGERWYSFRYGGIHFVSLYLPFGFVRLRPGDAQHDWLVADLAAAAADPSVNWTIVFCHIPPWCAAMDYPNQRADLPPIFERHGVDVCFSGHAHLYERSLRLLGDSVVDRGPNYLGTGPGTVYCVVGTGGAPVLPPAVDWWTARSVSSNGHCLVEVSGDTLAVSFRDQYRMDWDQWSIIKNRALVHSPTEPPVVRPARDATAPRATPGPVSLLVFDAVGRRVARTAGAAEEPIPNLTPGVYFVRPADSAPGKRIIVR